MKPVHSILSLVLCLTAFTACLPTPQSGCRYGKEWKTVDNFSGADGLYSAALGSAANPQAVFVAGFDTSSDTDRRPIWTVRSSADRGESWTTVDAFGAGGSIARAAAADPRDGSVYAAGEARLDAAAEATAWTVRKTSDNGATWTTVDAFQDEGHDSRATSVAVAKDGTVYVAGDSGGWGNGGTDRKWILRQSSDGGATWSPADLWHSMNGAEAAAVAVTDTGRVYVGGRMGRAGQGEWIVRSRAPGETAWATVDTFRFPEGRDGMVTSLGVNGDGTVYAAGFAMDSDQRSHWVVRSSSGPTPVEWSTVDDTLGAAERWAEARGLGFARGGALVVTGFQRVISPEEEGFGLTTRAGLGGRFESADFIAPWGRERNAQGSSVTRGAQDDLFVSGGWFDGEKPRWLVRRLKCE